MRKNYIIGHRRERGLWLSNDMRRCIALAISLFLLLPSGVSAAVNIPTSVDGACLYERSSDEFSAAVVIDVASGKRLYAYQPKLVWPGASLTKLMTALVFVHEKLPWNRLVSLLPEDDRGGAKLIIGKKKATMSLRDLLYSSIVASANNATIALARVTGITTKQFVRRMNLNAKTLGLSSTKYVEPSGIDDANVTTAEDLAKLAKAAFDEPLIRAPASTPAYAFTIRNTGVKKLIHNTNTLLTKDDELNVIGGKTGFLYSSRYNFVTRVKPERGSSNGPELIVVVLGAPTMRDSFDSGKALAKWAWKAYRW